MDDHELQEQEPTQPTPSGMSQDDERLWGSLCHFAGLLNLVSVPSLIVVLIVWLMKKDQSAFVDEQGKEALNFQISVWIALVACIPLAFIIIGVLLIPVILIGGIVFSIIAGIKARDGESYRYPYTIRLIK